MNFIVEFDIRAETEYSDAIEWYEDQESGLGSRFEESVQKLLKHIEKNPLIFPNKRYNTREGKVEDFPYLIVYKVFPAKNIMYITSIFHTSRNPRRKYRK